MDDLISRQAAIDALADYIRRVCLVFSDYMTDNESEECATCVLQSVPSAQPERKKGRWLCSDDMYETGVCSACKWDSGEAWVNCKKWFNYCHNCGADMRGE